MTHQTAILSSYEAYLTSENESPDDEERDARLTKFPFAIMLELGFAEYDYANRWCWQRFGPPMHECWDSQSEYPSCDIDPPHCHLGIWTHHWYVKTAYNFGFCEWYFADKSHHDQFLASVPELNWGENYPK